MPDSHEYVELHAHTAFSFLDGTSQPDELVDAAAQLGYTHMAVTDHDNLCGALEFAHAARTAGLRPITGSEVTVIDHLGRSCHVTLLARTAEGYANLCRLITASYAPREGLGADTGAKPPACLATPAGRAPAVAARISGSATRPDPAVTIDQLCAHAEGVTLLTGCARHGLLLSDIQAQQHSRIYELMSNLQEVFGREHVYVELQLPQRRGALHLCHELERIAKATHAEVVATGNVHAHTIRRGRLHDLLVAIRLRTTIDACAIQRDGNLARVLRTPSEMVRRFSSHPRACSNTLRIAESIEFDLTQGVGYRYPDLTAVDGAPSTADDKLSAITISELEHRYAGQANLLEARARLSDELSIIRRHGLSGFFLLHHDVLQLALEVAHDVRGASATRQLNPPGRGRGSSVESIVCYLTGLSHIDPIEANLHMGRFLNDDLVSVPDIDLDFPRDIRHELLARVVTRYGGDRCAMVAAHATYRLKSAVRDVGKALGLPSSQLAKVVASTDAHSALWAADATASEHTGPRWDAFRAMTSEISGLPRKTGQHSGGVIISTDSLSSIVPIQPAATPGRQLVQWDKDSCADAGFLKIDVLGLGMLSAIEECVETIALTEPTSKIDATWAVNGGVDLSRIPLDDAAVYSEIQAGDTVGTFQIESRAQIQSLRRVRPTCFQDLIVQVALIRPGPIIGQSVNPYIKARERIRADPCIPVEYDHPLLEPVLKDTYGAIIFQDQVIEASMAVAGFTAGEADGLRRAMTRKRAIGSVEVWRSRFVSGAAKNCVSEDTANTIFDKVIGFCHYGFPRAHSAAFALLAYQSAWLRHYYPAHFLAALMNAQPMGFYSPDSLLRDASRHAVPALPADINKSSALCTVERTLGAGVASAPFGRRVAGSPLIMGLRVGLTYISGISFECALKVHKERELHGEYSSIEDLLRRTQLALHSVEQLIMAGACDSLIKGQTNASRRDLLWRAGLTARPVTTKSTSSPQVHLQEVLEISASDGPSFKQLSMWDEMVLDYTTQGLSTRAHPVELLRPMLGNKVLKVSDLLERAQHGELIELVGAITARQKPPTAKGILFLLVEDETGQINVIVKSDLYKAQRATIRGEPILRICGRIERQGPVLNLVARDVHRLPHSLIKDMQRS